eukprot:6592270-Alexandrium_andersonii.AAC.1
MSASLVGSEMCIRDRGTGKQQPLRAQYASGSPPASTSLRSRPRNQTLCFAVFVMRQQGPPASR